MSFGELFTPDHYGNYPYDFMESLSSEFKYLVANTPCFAVPLAKSRVNVILFSRKRWHLADLRARAAHV